MRDQHGTWAFFFDMAGDMTQRSESSFAPENNDRRICLLVLGMHRSGTSALSKLLNLLGCDLPLNQMPANAGNETGYWESSAIFQLNEDILASAGTSWDDWQPFNKGWYNSPVTSRYLSRAREVLRNEFNDSPLFVLKDPRNCRLSEFWLRVLEKENIDPAIVIPIRNPLEVAESLETRDGMDTGYAQLLWLRHVLDAESSTRGLKRHFSTYDQILDSWQATASSMQEAFGICWPRLSAVVDREANAFLRREQRHHERSTRSILDNPSVSRWLQTTYRTMLDWSINGENEEQWTTLDIVRAEFDAASPIFADLIPQGLRASAPGSRLALIEQLRETGANQESLRNDLLVVNEKLEAAERERDIAQEQLNSARSEHDATLLAMDALQKQEAIVRHESEERAALYNITVEQLDALRAQLNIVETYLAEKTSLLTNLEIENAALKEEQKDQEQLSRRTFIAENTLLQRDEEIQQTRHELGEQTLARKLLEEQISNLRIAIAEAEAGADGSRDIAQQKSLLEQELLALRQELEEARSNLIGGGNVREAEKELADIRMSYQQAQAEVLRERSIRTSVEARLSERFAELSTLTSLLRQRDDDLGNATAQADWLRRLNACQSSFPKWWSLLPTSMRKERENERLQSDGVFDKETYLARYPDVAAAGVDPLRHYLTHGMSEGRIR